MLKTGLANMAYGVVIALVGALITGVTYAMVSGGGGTYVVAYGAFVVGAWRFLLGLFQVLRGAVSGLGTGSTISNPQAQRAAGTSSTATSPVRTIVQEPSGTLHIIGGLLIADTALRIYSLGVVLLHLHVPLGEMFSSLPLLVFFATTIAFPALLIVGGVAAGVLLLRDLPAAIPFGIGFCVAALLLQAYGLWRLSTIAFRVPWLGWAFVSIHLTISIVSLIVLARSSTNREVAVASAGQTGAPMPADRRA